MNVVLICLYFDVNYKFHDKLRLNHNTEWQTFSLALFIDSFYGNTFTTLCFGIIHL
jgi:hypothetical protein